MRDAADERLGRLERDGFVIVDGALDPGHVERLIAAVDRMWARHRGSPPGPGAEPLHLLAFAGEDDAFVELLDHPATLPIVVDAIGYDIFMYHCHLDVHPPNDVERPKVWMWHQDGGVQNHHLDGEPRPRMSVKVAYFLTDLSEPGRGNFVVLRGSHRRNAIDRPRDDDNAIAGAEPILARPGTAVVFDRRLWHMRSENRSSITRKALFYAYTYRWVRPRDDLRIPPERLGAITPVRAQLLGAGSDAIGYWMPDEGDVPLRRRFRDSRTVRS